MNIEFIQDKRYLIYNSSFSKIRVVDNVTKKVVIRLKMEDDERSNTSDDNDEFVGNSIDEFIVDEEKKLIWYTYVNDENLYIYSIIKRQKVHITRIYDPKLRNLSKFLF